MPSGRRARADMDEAYDPLRSRGGMPDSGPSAHWQAVCSTRELADAPRRTAQHVCGLCTI